MTGPWKIIGKDQGGIKYIIEQVHGGKMVDDVHRHFLKKFIAPELNHEPDEIPASQVSYPTKIVDLQMDEDENTEDHQNETKVADENITVDSEIQSESDIVENNIDGDVIKDTGKGVEISSRTRGKLVLNESQLSAQQTHQLGVRQIQPQIALKLEKPRKVREYELRSRNKLKPHKSDDGMKEGVEE